MRRVKFTQSGTLGDLWFAQFDEKEVTEDQYRLLLSKGWIFGERPPETVPLSDGHAVSGLSEFAAFFSDRRLTLADLDDVPQSQRVGVFSRGSLPQALGMSVLPFSAFRLRVKCRETVRVKQWVQAHGRGAALWLNGQVVDVFVAGKMSLNLLNHGNEHFVRNTTRLDIERLENGSLKIVPLVDNAFVGVATVSGRRTMSIEQGKVYTLSFEYQGSVDNLDYCYLVSKAKGNFHFGKHAVSAAIDEPNIFSYTFVAPWSADDVGVLIGFHNTKNQSVTIDKVRFELGAKRRQAVVVQEWGDDAEVPTHMPIDMDLTLPQGENELVWLLDGENDALQVWGDFVDGVRIQAI